MGNTQAHKLGYLEVQSHYSLQSQQRNRSFGVRRKRVKYTNMVAAERVFWLARRSVLEDRNSGVLSWGKE